MSSRTVPSKQPAASFYDRSCYAMADSIGHQLFHLMAQLRREIEARMAEHGLTDAQWKPLWLLQQGKAGTALELAREMQTDAGATTRMLDRLAAKGLIERVRSETDRRVVDIVLTDAGHTVVQHVPEVLSSINNDYLRGFSREEWQQMMNFIGRMRANGQALREEDGE